MTLTLGIETSCDETSAALVEDGRLVRSNVVSSQIALHAPFGGVVPEIASREHIRAIVPVVEAALREANITRSDLDVVAATQGPGLAGALLVGLTFARSFALALNLPFTPVNHLEGHLHSVWLAPETPLPPEPELPMLALIVSGGHTELVLVEDHGSYRVVGRTLDDAAGEAFDKVARLLGLSYPGGPAIQKVAAGATAPVTLPRAWLPGTYDFSFSGLKTAVLHMVQAEAAGQSPAAGRGVSLPQIDISDSLSPEQVANIAAGFQESVVDVLTTKTARAAQELGAVSVALVGGVAASGPLRTRMQERISQPLHIAPLAYCTDNAAMIASAGYYVPRTPDDVDVRPGLSLQSA
jgi:N6-L-threonylcarbamoyladenine synthase